MAAGGCRAPITLLGVLADVDVSLRTWLTAVLPARTRVTFGSPAELAGQAPRGAAVNLFLHSVVPDPVGMAACDVRLRDADGRVGAIGQPARRYALAYQVTAWCDDVLDEHRLLGAILVAHAGNPALGRAHLHGELAALPDAVPVDIGTVPAQLLWEAIGIPMRSSIELVVVVPAVAAAGTDVARPVENLALVAGHSAPRPQPRPRPRHRWKRTSLNEAAPDGADLPDRAELGS
jgi:hypothetical protein